MPAIDPVQERLRADFAKLAERGHIAPIGQAASGALSLPSGLALAARTTGGVSPWNVDNFLLVPREKEDRGTKPLVLVAVCQGKMENEATAVASGLSLRELHRRYREQADWADAGRELGAAIEEANHQILSLGKRPLDGSWGPFGAPLSPQRASFRGIGASVAALSCTAGAVTLSRVGPCGAYLCCGKKLLSVADLHDDAFSLLLGSRAHIDVEETRIPVSTGDTLVLCTSTLRSVFEGHRDALMADLRRLSPSAACEAILERLAEPHGSATLVVMKIGEPSQ